MTVETDPVRRAVETLSRLVATPPPPRGLRVGVDSSKRTSLWVPLVAAILVVAAAGAWLILNRPGAPASRQFVVEHLRVGGKTVEPRVMEVRVAPILRKLVGVAGTLVTLTVFDQTEAPPRLNA